MELPRTLFRLWPVRALASLFFFTRGTIRLVTNPFAGVDDLCWVSRVGQIEPLAAMAYRIVARIATNGKGADNRLIRAFLDSQEPERCTRQFLEPGGGLDPVFRDAIVLKPSRPGEKGVILLKYTAKFNLFVSVFDLDKVTRDFYIVLEPCWSGYCDPSILMFLSSHHEVIVQSPDRADYEFIERLGSNLVPVSIGASDWVDSDLFAGGDGHADRPYDLVMVANWGRHKNHRRLFEALKKVKRRPIRVLLIGFEWAGRTAEDVLREMQHCNLQGVHVDIREKIPASEVAKHLRRSKVFVLLSEKEGANKALVEALFCGVPAIVYEGFIGGATGKVNPQTGMLTSFTGLPAAIETMLDRHQEFTPRAWALSHSGSRNATEVLNRTLKGIAQAKGEPWTLDIVEKVNAPNLAYKAADAIPEHLRAGAIASAYLR